MCLITVFCFPFHNTGNNKWTVRQLHQRQKERVREIRGPRRDTARIQERPMKREREMCLPLTMLL